MKLVLTAALAATLATSAFAGTSDRYNDQRFDTKVGHLSDVASSVETRQDALTPVALSSRNAKGSDITKTYPYANPYGVGPYNDSR